MSAAHVASDFGSILPDQGRSREYKAEELLLLGVMDVVLLDLDKYRHPRGPAERRFRDEIEAWLYREDTDWPFSCSNICAHFGWSQAAIRERVLDPRWRYGDALLTEQVAAERAGGE